MCSTEWESVPYRPGPDLQWSRPSAGTRIPPASLAATPPPTTPRRRFRRSTGGSRSPWMPMETASPMRHRPPVGIAALPTAVTQPIISSVVPNPFSPTTRVTFALPGDTRPGEVARLEVFDVGGRSVRVLHNGPANAGAHTVVWDGTDASGSHLAAGVFFAKLSAPGGHSTKKLVLLR
ncbi:MAG: hypothetical protein CME07_03280 [Gemmatimonadetes bacterium]|nr:hypothetical protein [Gemmatimonadota bacterium]